MTINFTAIPGANPTYYVTGGDLHNPVFVGSGTVYCDHKIIFDGMGDVTIGDTGHNVYLVASDNIEFHATQNMITVYGGIYTGHDFNVDSDIDVFGPVVVGNNCNIHGKNTDGNLTTGDKPWFDPRSPLSTVIDIQNFHDGGSP